MINSNSQTNEIMSLHSSRNTPTGRGAEKFLQSSFGTNSSYPSQLSGVNSPTMT